MPLQRRFLKKVPVSKALHLLDERIVCPEPVTLPLDQALHYVTATDIRAEKNLPEFQRALMDGYAVIARSTFSTSIYAPISLRIAGESRIGEPCLIRIQETQAVKIATGAQLPENADAVVMIEDTLEEGEQVRILAPVPPFKNIGLIGEDAKTGDILIPPATLLKPQHIGLLCAAGIFKIPVFPRPKIAIISTGNELVPSYDPKASIVQIYDSNAYLLSGMIQEALGVPLPVGIVKDNEMELRQAIQSQVESEVDMIVISGATSVGKEDYVPSIVQDIGELPVHGIAMRPGSPAGIGFIKGKPIFLLPGNPVATYFTFDCFVRYAISRFQGLSGERRQQKVSLALERKIASTLGMTEFVRVSIKEGLVYPIRTGGSSLQTTLTRSQGFIIVPQEREGFEQGERVEVYLYE